MYRFFMHALTLQHRGFLRRCEFSTQEHVHEGNKQTNWFGGNT